MIIETEHFIYTLFISFTGKHGRSPRFFTKKVKDVLRQINVGKNIILETYSNQLWNNWRSNYEYVYKAYFSKVEHMLMSHK